MLTKLNASFFPLSHNANNLDHILCTVALRAHDGKDAIVVILVEEHHIQNTLCLISLKLHFVQCHCFSLLLVL